MNTINSDEHSEAVCEERAGAASPAESNWSEEVRHRFNDSPRKSKGESVSGAEWR